jgi:hypothetical protein
MNKQTITYKNGNGHGHHGKSPAEIEREIAATRMRMENTIQAIKNDLTPGQLVDQAVQYFRDGKVGEVAGKFGTSVGRGASSAASSIGVLVKENPLPAALIGAGLAWMAASSYKAKHPSIATSSTMNTYGEMSGGFGESASLGSFNEGEEYIGTTGDLSTTSAAEPGRVEAVKEKAQGVVSSVKAKTHSIKERASSGTSAIKARASSSGQAVKQRASAVSHSAAEKARTAKQRTISASVKAKDGVTNTYEQQPLIIGAIAIGVGALLGAALPISSRENRMLGRKRDDLVEKATKKADEFGVSAIERAKGVVDQGMQKVKSGIEQKAGVVESYGTPTTGVMSGTSAYGTSSVNPFVETRTTTSVSTTTQAAPLSVPEENLAGTAGGSVEGGPLTDLSQEREVGGMEPSSLPPKGRGPGF